MNPTHLPGSRGEHELQIKYGSQDRANAFYEREVHASLSPRMQQFIVDQEFLFVSTSDRQGNCDCSPRFGEPGFIRVLDSQHLLYPEYRGNGVFASLGNIAENPHIGLVIIDFYRDCIGLHINGTARVVENDESELSLKLAQSEKHRPNRWVLVAVEEAYVHCSKHIPLLKKMDRRIEWGTDNAMAKKSNYFAHPK